MAKHALGPRPLPFAVRGGDTREPRLVEFILLAEFDIDTGSTLRHSIPGPVHGITNDWFAEIMLPEGAHNREVDWTLTFLNRVDGIMPDGPPRLTSAAGAASKDETTNTGSGKFLYLLNLVTTRHDPTVRRGAVVKAVAVVSQHPFVNAFRDALSTALDHYYATPDAGVLTELFEALNAVDLTSCPNPLPHERQLMWRGVAGPTMGSAPEAHTPPEWVWHTTMALRGASIPLEVPVHLSSDELFTGEAEILTRLVRTFGDATMRIFHAVLAGQRVLFVGYNHAAGDVCQFVLAAVSMVSPPVTDVLRRTYPYASLTDLSFLETPGFIAGVTNPVFEENTMWWDLLCVLNLPENSGTVLTPEEKAKEDGKKGPVAPAPPGDGGGHDDAGEDHQLKRSDAAFISKVLSGAALLGEDWVKSMFHDATTNIMLTCFDAETAEASSAAAADGDGGATASSATGDDGGTGAAGSADAAGENPEWAVAPHSLPARVAAYKAGCNASSIVRDPWAFHGVALAGEASGARLHADLRRLQTESAIPDGDALAILNRLEASLQSEPALQILLTLLPESTGGLYPIAAGLLHKSEAVRRPVLALLERLEQHKSTAPAIGALNQFLIISRSRSLSSTKRTIQQQRQEQQQLQRGAQAALEEQGDAEE